MKKVLFILCSFAFITNLSAQTYYNMWRGYGNSGKFEWIANSAMRLGKNYAGIEFATTDIGRGVIDANGIWYILDKNETKNYDRLRNTLMNSSKNSFNAQFIADVNLVARRLIVANLETNHDNIKLYNDGTNAYIEANGDEDGLHLKSQVAYKIHLHDQVGIGTTGFDKKIVPGASLTVSGGVFIGPKKFSGSYDITSKLDKCLLWVQKGIVSENYSLVKVADWSDHVFNTDYLLRPLSEVETFIKENNHLPDVPSEKEIVEDGYNIHDMNKVFMQKIEELTLYVIQQQKEIEKLKEELKQ